MRNTSEATVKSSYLNSLLSQQNGKSTTWEVPCIVSFRVSLIVQLNVFELTTSQREFASEVSVEPGNGLKQLQRSKSRARLPATISVDAPVL